MQQRINVKPIIPYFSQNPLDRLDQLRRNDDAIYEYLQTASIKYILCDGNSIIIDKTSQNCFFSQEVIDEYMINDNQIVLLGVFENMTYCAISLKKSLQEVHEKVALREYVLHQEICQNEMGILAQAFSLIQWHEAHKFCSSCGHATLMTQGGFRRDCINCHKEHFPRVDPVVIMLVTHNDYCLLGRSHRFKQNFYSCLAGYVESGETFEQAAIREVYEEAGIQCKNARYLLSQPWPFPSTLMIGMQLEATTKNIQIDTHELQDAKWVHKSEVKAVLEGDTNSTFLLPTKIAIARNLLELWVNED